MLSLPVPWVADTRSTESVSIKGTSPAKLFSPLFQKTIFNGIDKRLPGGFDDVGRDADRAPGFPVIRGGLDDGTDLRGCALAGGDDTYLEVGQADRAQFGIKPGQAGAEGAVQSMDGTVPFGDGQDILLTDSKPERGFRDRFRVA